MATRLVTKFYCNSPVIVILGSTGTGKSKLAVNLAKRFNGEIINADAMQTYKGLDIITNKVTPEEQGGIRHHVLGVFSPLKSLTVGEYRHHALRALNDIIDRKKLPIIVGGTYYYVEALLYDFVLDSASDDNGNLEERSEEEKVISEDSEGKPLPKKRMKMSEYHNLHEDLEKYDNKELYRRLKMVDPKSAEQLHPNCRRKIIRALMVPLQFGESLSSLLEKQRSQPGGCSSGGPLKMPKSLILTLECESDVLNTRLDARVDDMISRGLVEELLEFHSEYNEKLLLKDRVPDYTKGIFQSIGFKEFHEFLILSPELRESEEGKKLFQKGVEQLKLVTKRYAKTQRKWIRNRFVKNGKRQLPPIYSLNGTDASKLEENVFHLAEHIVECHLANRKPSVDPVATACAKVEIDRTYECECGKILIGKDQWEIHIKGKSHIREMKKKKKQMEEERGGEKPKDESVESTQTAEELTEISNK